MKVLVNFKLVSLLTLLCLSHATLQLLKQSRASEMISQAMESREKRMQNARFLKQIEPNEKLFANFDFSGQGERDLKESKTPEQARRLFSPKKIYKWSSDPVVKQPRNL